MNWDMENKRHQTISSPSGCPDQLISIIEEQQRTEQGTLAHTLSADEMNVSIELYLGVWDMGTIYPHIAKLSGKNTRAYLPCFVSYHTDNS